MKPTSITSQLYRMLFFARRMCSSSRRARSTLFSRNAANVGPLIAPSTAAPTVSPSGRHATISTHSRDAT